MPSPRFMQDMGVASILAGVVMLCLAALHPERAIRRMRRMARGR